MPRSTAARSRTLAPWRRAPGYRPPSPAGRRTATRPRSQPVYFSPFPPLFPGETGAALLDERPHPFLVVRRGYAGRRGEGLHLQQGREVDVQRLVEYALS